jgi:dTDP-4-dehydrorhamnose 3,5-epimerase
MIFTETAVAGAFVIVPEPLHDERGFFARAWCSRESALRGLASGIVQASISFNRKKGTLRGLHYQVAPHAEAKLVRCTAGALHDVVLDLRPDSPTFLRHAAVVLDAARRRTVYVPEGVAHGFQTLADDTEVLYMMSEFHDPASARGVRWDDPAFGIVWPSGERTMSERDRSYPDFHVEREVVP